MRKIIPFLMFLLTLSPGFSLNYTCVNNATSNYTDTIYVSGSGVSITYNESCNNGCNNATGRCNPSSFDPSNYMFFLIFPIIAFVLFYFTSILKSEDWAIHLLLMIAALAFLVAPIGILQGMQEQAQNAFLGVPLSGLYFFLVIVMVIIIFYYILKTIIQAVRVMKSAKGGAVG